MRKLFLSFLGTSLYGECTYFDDSITCKPTRYIQIATLEKLNAASWSETDAIRIFLTDKAREENWDKNKTTRYDNNRKAEIPYVRLQKELEDMHLAADIKDIAVKDGKDEAEMWDIFQTIYNEIGEGDELYIDLTHAFRYLPMLVLVLSNYAKFLKKATVKSITYGNYEVSNKGKDPAPIVDLTPLVQLQDWTTAAADFLENGHVGELVSLAHSFNDKAKDKDEAINNFINILSVFANDRQTCRGPKITDGKISQQLHDAAQAIEATRIVPLTPIFQKIKDEITPPSNVMLSVVQAAEWCFHNYMWQQSLSILQEGIVTVLCQRHDMDWMNKDSRGLVNSAFYCSTYKKRKDRRRWKVEPKNLSKVLELLSDEIIADEDIRKIFQGLTDLRNNYMHAGYSKVKDEEPSPDIKPEDIEVVIQNTKALILPRIRNDFKAEPYQFTSKVFINISNHPSEEWDEAQTTAAKEYGPIKDIAFPSIPTEADSDAIDKMAKAVIRDIFEEYDDTTDITVHVMGEMTLTFTLVSMLKACGIRCVASTTDRKVNELGKGQRISEFSFARFREY